MKQRPISIEGEKWLYIKHRVRGGTAVYRSQDNYRYLRLGKKKEISKEVSLATKFRQLGFPVPLILGRGRFCESYYYIEESIGTISFGDVFRKEYFSRGKVRNESFHNFCNIIDIFLKAQFNSSKAQFGRSKLRSGIHLKNVLMENKDINQDKLMLAVVKAENNLTRLPLTINHGDLSPFNTFQKGVIDFEHSFITPIGFDVLIAVLYERFWNYAGPDGKSNMPYDFTNEQIAYYLERIDKIAKDHEVIALSSFTDSFLVLKSVWSLAHEKKIAQKTGDALKWHFRKKILSYCVDQYLHNKSINTEKFARLGN